MSRESIVTQLAPIAPPCFSSRDQWVTYLQSAATAQKDAHAPGPLLFEKGRAAAFNPLFRFCEDCRTQHRDAMERAGRCRPDHLVVVIRKRKEVEHAGA